MSNQISVRLQSRNYTFEQSAEILKDILNKGGHPGCFSGLDINFASEVEFTVNAAGETLAR
jgi:hypothetical protein